MIAGDPGNGELDYRVKGSTSEVLLLQSHVVLTSLWVVAAAATAFLAVPRLRRALSPRAGRALEARMGTVISALFGASIGTFFTGMNLLLEKTPYQAPFTSRAWENVTSLPHAQSYFLLLYGKILVFGLMLAASIILVVEAVQPAPTASAATVTHTRQQVALAAVVIIIGGTLAIGGAVTGLKYLHELIETASAAAAVRSLG